MRLALARAGVSSDQVVQVNAHGTGTRLNDEVETAAIAEVCAPHRPPVTSVKRVLGHCVGAAGALEAVTVLQSFTRRLIPPAGVDLRLAPEVDADVVAVAPRPFEPGPTLSNSFGIGGMNGTLVLLPAEWR